MKEILIFFCCHYSYDANFPLGRAIFRTDWKATHLLLGGRTSTRWQSSFLVSLFIYYLFTVWSLAVISLHPSSHSLTL